MKKILFLLLSTIAMYGQVPADATPLENVQITNNTQSTTATKVNVQEANGTINTISKSDLVNVVEVNDVPSLPLVGEVGKIYVVKNVNKIYRWNGTFYQELAVADISGKENIANKQNSLAVDGTGVKFPTVDATNAGLATKAPISSVHNPVTLGTANGLSLATQQLSLGLASSGVTGALSGTDWNTFNNKVNGTGTNNFLTKWSGTNTIAASGAWQETSNRLANAADNGVSEFQVTGQIDLKSKNTQGDGGQLGAELLTTGSSDASWTGTSFATGYTHVAGSVTTLTSALAPVINNLYQVAYTVTGRTAGSFTIAFGGTTTAGITSTGAVGHIASTTGTLVITPTSDFNGTIVLSIKQITAGTASFVFRDNGGTIRSELRILGGGNTANGTSALQNNTTGNGNIANGVSALRNNTTGNYNIANGVGALFNNTTGNGNTANGESALRNNTTGNYNTANGANAGRLIANGSTLLTVANKSTFLGVDTKALSDNSTNETVVGYNAIGDGSNTVSIGSTSVVSSRLRGRILQGNVVDNLIDSGQFSGNVLATGFKTASGTASQFLKANGSVDSNTYLTSASLPTVDQTIIDGSANAVSGNAVFDGLATKFQTPTGLTTNYLPKWNGSGFGNSSVFDDGSNIKFSKPVNVQSFNDIFFGDRTNAPYGLGLYFNPNLQRFIFYNGLGGNEILSLDRQNNNVLIPTGRVLINKTDDDLTNQLQVAGTISASPATTANQVVVKSQLDAVAGTSGSYTPTVSASTNCVSPGALPSTYTKNGNTVTLILNVLAANFTVANTLTAITVNLPVNRTLTDVKNIGSGSGFNTLGEYWAAIAQTGANNNTVLVSFRTPSTNTGNIILFVQYDITK